MLIIENTEYAIKYVYIIDSERRKYAPVEYPSLIRMIAFPSVRDQAII